jgi:hypothetical protein
MHLLDKGGGLQRVLATRLRNLGVSQSPKFSAAMAREFRCRSQIAAANCHR